MVEKSNEKIFEKGIQKIGQTQIENPLDQKAPEKTSEVSFPAGGNPRLGLTSGMSEQDSRLLKQMGLSVCSKCGSSRRTDLTGKLFCPMDDKNCPLLQL